MTRLLDVIFVETFYGKELIVGGNRNEQKHDTNIQLII